MGPLPTGVIAGMNPMPADFTPSFEDRDKPPHVYWGAGVAVTGLSEPIAIELGFSKAGITSPVEDARRRERLRLQVCQIMELARLGRVDLMRHARADRHTGRKAKPITALPTVPAS